MTSALRGADAKWDHLTEREASMKKLTAILLTLCICVTVVGCGDTGSEKKTGGTAAPTPAKTDKK
jgi:hypothetical protein